MRSIILATILGLALATAALADSLTGRVVAVTDGDTLQVLTPDKVPHKIRLLGIDAPERTQDFGSVAKGYLSDLAFQKTVTVEYRKKDRYGRILGKIFREGLDLNLEMLRAGYAWHYKQYAREQYPGDSVRYAKAEADARAGGKGLWHGGGAVEPWNFRRTKKSGKIPDKKPDSKKTKRKRKQ